MKAIKIGKFNFDNKVWNGISSGAKDFITQLLTYDTAKRPSAEKAIQHPWVQE
jgi:serine/threonine protein kinase